MGVPFVARSARPYPTVESMFIFSPGMIDPCKVDNDDPMMVVIIESSLKIAVF